ncbi:MAG TPA: DivIVA domain-containing protein [Acidimicrobiales bacterium]|nr:DivIVA domain-containing protein [Acidimicrobiales bacterium]
MADVRPPISSSRIATGDIARHSFAIVRRGFDPDEVRSYLQSVSRSLEALEEREQELRAAVAEAEERAAHPIVDEATLTASLGQHSAQILRHAHDEAAKIVAQAQEGAASLLRETQIQTEELQSRTETSSAERVAEVELLVANAQQEARVESERILSDAVAEGEAVIGKAKDEGRALLEQVQEARRRVLADLASRRRALGIQIEQLRAARDEMAASVHGVRDRVDGILSHLDHTDEEARAAAVAVAEQFRLHGGPEEPHDQDALGEAMGDAPAEGPAPAVRVIEVDAEAEESSAAAAVPEPGEVDPNEPVTAAAAPSVDELFARIRQGTDDPVTGGGEGGEGGATSPEADAPEAATQAMPVVVVEPVAESEGWASDAPPSGPDDGLIAQRDELLGPVTARLSRTVKRALGDDQNRLLDRIRNAPSMSGPDLLGPEADHVAVFESAVRGQLSEAFAAGATFGGAGAGGAPDDGTIEQSTTGLAHVVVTMLRRQIEDGGGDVGDRVSAAYREWRGERVERVAGDYATQAFSAGVTAAGADRKLRWVVTSATGCSDCEDNALAGAVSASDVFPTGHAHPPAHSGCRCLVAPTSD